MVISLLKICSPFFLIIGLYFLISCTKKTEFERVFDIPPIVGIESINESISQNTNRRSYMYFGKFKGTQEDFFKLAQSLDLKKSEPTRYMIESSSNKGWWNPPNYMKQINLNNTYFKNIPAKEGADPDLNQEIIAIQVDDIIYIYKKGIDL